MYQSIYSPRKNGKRRLKWTKKLILFVSILVLAFGAFSGTVAYLMTSTDPLPNVFPPVKTDITFEEDFVEGNTVKENVTIGNACEYPVYIRATYAAYWAYENGSINGGAGPVELDLTIGDNWTKIGDLYYFNGIVDETESTTNFIVSCSAKNAAPEGCHLVVDIVAESIQAEPNKAAEEIWKMTFDGTTWDPIS